VAAFGVYTRTGPGAIRAAGILALAECDLSRASASAFAVAERSGRCRAASGAGFFRTLARSGRAAVQRLAVAALIASALAREKILAPLPAAQKLAISLAVAHSIDWGRAAG
jgi:hypothetical protein